MRGPGKVTYTQMLNRRGGIECDFTVTQLAEDRFWIVTGTAFGTHDRAWISSHAGEGVLVEDVTSRWACAGLWGPKARDILGPCTPDPLEFGYMNARSIVVGDVPVRAMRVTYVGELGWELYCPMEFGGALWRTLWEAGEPHGLVAGGYRAIDSLRLEKGYRVWGADITADDTPYEGGVGFAVKRDKTFIGSDALDDAARAAALLPRARRPALGGARQRAGARGRGDLRARDERRLRLHGRRVDRLRLPAGRARRARDRGRRRGVRGVDRRRGAPRAAVRSRRRTRARLESSGEMSTADTKALIEEAVANFQAEVPALKQLRLVIELELRGRGDIQLFRVEVPGPRITRDIASDAKVRLSVPRSHFNELAREGKVRHWREAFQSGTVKATGPAEILKLIQNVVEKQEERGRTRKLRAR